jgi:hypothetical protein
MKYFASYITEIFERSYPWRLFNSGDGPYWDYLFDVVKPAGSTEWQPDPGPKFTPAPRSIATTNTMNLQYRQANPGIRQRIKVEFTQYRGTTALAAMQRINRGLKGKRIALPVMESLWELGFATFIDTDGTGFDAGTDDDLGGDNTAHVTRVFGTIIEIVKDFRNRKKPVGIFWGTKPNARRVRSVIYTTIAKRLASTMGAKLYPMPSPRPEMANCTLAWWGDGEPWETVKKANPKS